MPYIRRHATIIFCTRQEVHLRASNCHDCMLGAVLLIAVGIRGGHAAKYKAVCFVGIDRQLVHECDSAMKTDLSVTGFWIPAYLLLWILVPEASTAADRLAMRGEPVNADQHRAKIRDYIESINGTTRPAVAGVAGPIAFDANHDAINKPVVIVQVGK